MQVSEDSMDSPNCGWPCLLEMGKGVVGAGGLSEE